MGCGISKIDQEEASVRPKRSHKRDSNNVPANNYNTINAEEADDFVNDHHVHGASARKSVSSLLPIIAVNNNNNGVVEETDNVVDRDNYNNKGHSRESSSYYEREDAIAYSASLSFREYCADIGSSHDGNGRKDENCSQGESGSNVEKDQKAEQESQLSYEKGHGSRSPERHMKRTRKGFRSAMHKPAGWIGKSKK